MKRTMVRYKLKADQGGENERLVKAVFEQLAREKPDNLRYVTFKMPDGVSFVHIAETPPDSNPLVALQTFKEFTAQIKDRCEEPPVATELTEVGAHRFFS